MRGFGFRTVPNYPPEREWLVMTAILVLTLLISSIVLAAAAAAIEPDIRLVIAGVAWWFAGVTIEGVRRHYARARGVSFVDDWDYARIYFRWSVGEPGWLQWLRMVPAPVFAAIAALSIVHGVQFWDLPLSGWVAGLSILALMSVVLPITGKLRPDRENPPRFHWSFYAILVALFLYPNMASIAGAAIAMGLISLLLVTRYFIGKLP